ncbi:hypothetical protein DSO57_1016038 [Entomophthora muscae]|uniref:Uncharacterized protein n=1 Tax=Entomophthora muscae TaxID=34485 RepID=A0ACC2UES9_9FUNG|nr:hypothetical protein DSO57_1016038 [Entomophthora muscae]
MKFYFGLVFSVQAALDCSGDREITQWEELNQIKECINYNGALSFNFNTKVEISLPNLVEAGDLSFKTSSLFI